MGIPTRAGTDNCAEEQSISSRGHAQAIYEYEWGTTKQALGQGTTERAAKIRKAIERAFEALQKAREKMGLSERDVKQTRLTGFMG